MSWGHPRPETGGAPVRRTFVVEADGGSRGNPGPAGYGAVVRDAASGQTLRETAEFLGHATNNVAEYRGLLAGLRAAHELDPHAAVLVRMDSKLVVEQMSGRWKIKHPDMRPLALEAGSVFPPQAVTYEWIPRAENKHADRLANEAMDAGKRGVSWQPGASTAELDTAGAAPATAGAGSAGAESADTDSADAGSADPGPTTSADPGPTAPAVRVGWGPDMGTPTTFVLLRHGETVLTPEKRFSGSGGSDPELSAVGRRQAAAVADTLAARGTIEAVVASPLRRCQETAAAVAGRLGLSVRTEDGLRETDFGAWEGLTFAQVRERHPEDLQAWLGSADVSPTGGGESFDAVARRVARSRDQLLARYAGRTVLVVSHVTPVKTLVRLALGAPVQSLFRMELAAASLTAVAYYADGNASLRLLNDTAHLR
ncbi:bifunctional RNase H/acid phosphatase [Streptomyces tubbatahanensis]|uniref:Bifunctional RNase H/acid phosphatase n=1 Tax=Streptomyces tubbatahanensis TaxID=2923272 RepID=A0ABY3XQW2_9ACTN|nr:bifunctional RNase H/acid phosphatase [Streptomyces tubbatahanensis]UNS96799.1 bifunctional RNase H/acid phosphatase [Streptomyces tubbatahanensis]